MFRKDRKAAGPPPAATQPGASARGPEAARRRWIVAPRPCPCQCEPAKPSRATASPMRIDLEFGHDQRQFFRVRNHGKHRDQPATADTATWPGHTDFNGGAHPRHQTITSNASEDLDADPSRHMLLESASTAKMQNINRI